MNTRITQLPNGKFIGEVELSDIAGLTATEACGWGNRWRAVYAYDNGLAIGVTKRGDMFFAMAQRASKGQVRELLAEYLDSFHGEKLEPEPSEG